MIPGEDVVLNRDGKKLRSRFEFRDTAHAIFQIAGVLEEFDLLDDGSLERGGRHWTIEGAERHTRTVLA